MLNTHAFDYIHTRTVDATHTHLSTSCRHKSVPKCVFTNANANTKRHFNRLDIHTRVHQRTHLKLVPLRPTNGTTPFTDLHLNTSLLYANWLFSSYTQHSAKPPSAARRH